MVARCYRQISWFWSRLLLNPHVNAPRPQCGKLLSRVCFVHLADYARRCTIEPDAVGAHPQALQVGYPIHIPGQSRMELSPTYPQIERRQITADPDFQGSPLMSRHMKARGVQLR
jgi:hypothetical protein